MCAYTSEVAHMGAYIHRVPIFNGGLFYSLKLSVSYLTVSYLTVCYVFHWLEMYILCKESLLK